MDYEYFKSRWFFLVGCIFAIGVFLLIHLALIGVTILKDEGDFESSLHAEIAIPAKSSPIHSSTSDFISSNSIKWSELDDPKAPFIIHVDKYGNYFWNGSPYNAIDIVDAATNFAGGSVLLAVDRDLEYGKVIDLMNRLKVARISDIGFIVDFVP